MPFRIAGDEKCEHNSLVRRGRDSGDNRYMECQDCGAVIVLENQSEIEENVRQEEEREESDPIKRIINKFFER